MELQTTDVQLALAKLLNHYPESGHNATSISKLAFDWHDLLVEENVTQRQFSAGVRHAVKTCRFFPKVADVLEGVAKYRANPKPVNNTTIPQIEAHTATPDSLTPEEMERNKKRIRMITEALAGRMSFEDAEREVNRMGHIEEFAIKSEQKTAERQ